MEFAEKFSTFSNTDLLNIVSNPDRYQEKAVSTAKEILARRNLSEEEMRIAEDELEAGQLKQLQKEERKREMEQKVKSLGHTIAETINPLSKEALSTGKIIKTVSIIYFILCLFDLYNELDMIQFMFSDSTARWDLATVDSFLPLLILPTAAFLFYKRKKIGWLLLQIFLSYALLSGIASVFFAIKWNWPIYSLLFSILLFTGLIYTINRHNVRAVFSISKQDMILSGSITAVIIGFLIYMIS